MSWFALSQAPKIYIPKLANRSLEFDEKLPKSLIHKLKRGIHQLVASALVGLTHLCFSNLTNALKNYE
ncbi:MAG: hypothetical protein DSY83_07290 [Flavobacteriia bacterium]|nr:MAG: hypothetical protein DSY83_07290 [Flavobacteriia bacterium]